MPTKEKNIEKRFLRDEVAGIILTDESCREYVEAIVSKALNIDEEIIKDHLVLKTPRVSSNINLKESIVDAIYDTEDIIINIEANLHKTKSSEVKNMRYIFHLILNQIPKGFIEEYQIKPIYQININGFDYFGEDEFLYKSTIMEEKHHKVRDQFITIIDINLDKLSKIPYNEIKEKEESLEQLLYIFVCSEEELKKVCSKSEIMEKVEKKLSGLTEDFAEGLYYNPKEYHDAIAYDLGKEEGIKERNIELAKAMLKKGMDSKDIIEITGLTEEEINSFQ